MKSFFTTIITAISHNRYTVIAVLACAVLVSGCTWLQPKAPSPIDGKLINRYQLDAQQAEFDAKFTAAKKMIAAQDQVWGYVFDMATAAASSVPGPLGGILAAIPTIAAVGLGLDNRRKNAVIEDKSAKIDELHTTIAARAAG